MYRVTLLNIVTNNAPMKKNLQLSPGRGVFVVLVNLKPQRAFPKKIGVRFWYTFDM